MGTLLVVNIIWILIICMAGLPSNFFILLVFGKRRRKISVDIWVMTLAVSNIGSCLMYLVQIGWLLVPGSRSNHFCSAIWFTGRSSVFVETIITALIAIDRYYAICHPFKWNKSKKRAIYASVIIMIISYVTNIHYALNTKAVAKSMLIRLCMYDGVAWLRILGNVVMSFLFFCGATSLWCYFMIWVTMRQHRRVMAAHRTSSTGLPQWQTPKEPINTVSSRVESMAGVSITGNLQDGKSEPNETPCPYATKQPQDHSLPEICEEAQSSRTQQHQGAYSNLVLNITCTQSKIHRQPPETLDSGTGYDANAESDRPVHDTRGQNQPLSHAPKKHDVMTKMLLLATIIYIVTLLPSAFLENLPPAKFISIQKSTVGEWGVFFSYHLRGVNFASNFFVYIAVNKDFRQSCWKLIKKNGIHPTN